MIKEYAIVSRTWNAFSTIIAKLQRFTLDPLRTFDLEFMIGFIIQRRARKHHLQQFSIGAETLKRPEMVSNICYEQSDWANLNLM